MAIRSLFLLALLTFLVLLVGCQSQRTIADNVPPPSFNGPLVLAQTPPPVAIKPAPVIAPPRLDIAKNPNAVPREWIPNTSARPWKWIVVHHSATPSGSAAVFDRMHRDKGWDELGYDFVIGNGTNSGDGQIEVGPRWPKQKWGAHAKTPDNRYNEYGIGICLVGNFDEQRPTSAQMRSLARLTSYLMKTYHISARDVIGHGETKATDCPGRYMNVAVLRRQIAQLADANSTEFNDAQAQAQAQTASARDPN